MSQNTATQRMLPVVGTVGGGQGDTITANGRSYTATAGTTVDAPGQDAAVLQANHWINTGGNECLGVGTTAQRPTTGLFPGATYVDTTLAYVVIYDGATWRNPSSGASV